MEYKNSKSFILSCNNIAKKFDNLDILKGVSFTVARGEKIGLVGPNGSGKSTLLGIIAGEIDNDAGKVFINKGVKLAYFSQVHESDDLSGGEVAKKVLDRITSSGADLFVLDEPTNNLDQQGLNRLEAFVSNSKNTFVVVSHDRAFLDKTVTKIFDIDPETKSLKIYDGNYSDYSKEKQSEINRQWKVYSDKTEKTKKLKNSLDQRISWVKKIEEKRMNIKNIPAQDTEKPRAAFLRDKEAKAGRRAKVIKDRLERYEESAEEIQKPKRLLPLRIDFESDRGSSIIFKLDGVVKKIGKKIIGPITLSVQYGQRLHLVGPNGSGKTTLLKMLLGEITPDSGEITRGKNIQVGYLSQSKDISRDNLSVIRHFLESVDIDESDARKILNRFRLTKEDVGKKVSTLSPGEYSRLVIAELLAKKPNCIVLDEPSNHLDLEVLEELEQGLVEYEGALIVVSHDRYFVTNLKLDSVLDMDRLQ